ncbi:MAG: hypothetical protein ACYC0O_06145 [Desulfurivibrionaceae bacterium]|jgi:hypothetical protein|nr:hypothetical protein [Pseudomonadota bacterium]MCG2822866.1 hypothetical protein [Desulfobulbaceae bacterium]MDP2003527.1 hypothetical protein [Desulfurivibrionaceae bacterium]
MVRPAHALDLGRFAVPLAAICGSSEAALLTSYGSVVLVISGIESDGYELKNLPELPGIRTVFRNRSGKPFF